MSAWKGNGVRLRVPAAWSSKYADGFGGGHGSARVGGLELRDRAVPGLQRGVEAAEAGREERGVRWLEPGQGRGDGPGDGGHG